MVIRTRDVARLLGWSVPTFRSKLPKLLRQGFPPKSDLIDGWHRRGVVDWIDRHFGMSQSDYADLYTIDASRKVLKSVRI